MLDQSYSLSITPLKGEIRFTLVILVFQLCFYPFWWMMPEDQVPGFFAWPFRFLISWIIFEVMVMLAKPIALEIEGHRLEARYLIAPNKRFDFEDIRGYSTLEYATRGRVRKSVVIYLNQGSTLEFSEHVVFDVSAFVAWLESAGMHHFGKERSSAFTCFPFRKYKKAQLE